MQDGSSQDDSIGDARLGNIVAHADAVVDVGSACWVFASLEGVFLREGRRAQSGESDSTSSATCAAFPR
jgi:hypothetical protein